MDASSKYRAEYEQRLHRVLSYIDAHLDERIDLARLAKEANFSAFHFHRIFAALVGETVGAYVTRRRVEQAASRLASQPRLPVLNIALAVGFGSAEAFSRAFKKHFGCSPSAWKTRPPEARGKKSKISQAKSRADQATRSGVRYASDMDKTITPNPVAITTRPSVRIAYLRYQGPFGQPAGRFWQDRVIPWLIASNLIKAPKYGVGHDDPDVTEGAKCRYDAGAEVGNDYVPSHGVQVAVLPGGLYASTKFRGTGAEILPAWQRFFREWLPASGYQLDARPCYEYYGPNSEFDEATGAFSCELCLPIAKL